MRESLTYRQLGLLTAIEASPGKWVEFGVVEQRYATMGATEREDFRELVAAKKHRAVERCRNSSSWILSNKSLVGLEKLGLVKHVKQPATGAWSGWHQEISWWTVTPWVDWFNNRLSWKASGCDFSYVPGWRRN